MAHPEPTARRTRIRDPERTRRVIVEAVLDALDEGNPAPTAKEVASRAGVSERTVFVHFRDLDEIRVAAAVEQARRVDELVEPISVDLPLGQRLDAFVAQGERLYAAQVGIRSAELAHSHHSPALTEMVRARGQQFRGQVEATFAPELAGTEHPSEVLDAIDAMLDWSFRHFLVARRGLSQNEASAAIRRGVLSALA